MANDESWETSSGLLDDYVLTIEQAWFAKPSEYREGKQTVLVIRGTATDPEDEDEVLDDEKQSYYSLGDGWEPDDGGESATHGSGKTKLNENSSMGRLINAAVGLGDDVISELKSRGPALQAATWRGLRFRFERVEFDFTNRRTGESGSYSVDLPTEFLGIDDAADAANQKASARKGAAKGRTKAAATETTEEAEAPAASSGGRRRRSSKPEAGGDNALRQAVIQFAAEWEDHSSFMEAVLDPDEFDQAGSVQGNEEILNDILDEDGAIWTASREIEPA